MFFIGLNKIGDHAKIFKRSEGRKGKRRKPKETPKYGLQLRILYKKQQFLKPINAC
jgi:hypothetical protein